MIYRKIFNHCELTINPDFNSTPLFNVEYIRNHTREAWFDGYYRPLIESDIRPIELCDCQWPWSTFKVILVILCRNKCSLFFHIQPEGLLRDAECDLLAIAKFLVLLNRSFCFFSEITESAIYKWIVSAQTKCTTITLYSKTCYV